MDCPEYRRLLLADPGHPSAEMRAHAAQCQACMQCTERVLRFEGRLERALQIDIGESSVSRLAGRGAAPGAAGLRAGLRRRHGSSLRHRGLAIAASALLAFGGGFLWLVAPGRSLAAAVVDHMAGEPDAWARTEVPVPKLRLDAVMSESGVQLKPGADLVSYVHSCDFRGHQVPHLVVQTPGGPVTVMVLVHESVRRGVRFNEQGYRGMIVPVPGHGSLAVLEHTRDADPKTIDAVTAQVLGALDWVR